ncbi:putative holin [Stenotrophomonas sp.]|uniref:putative holin n=1 Tax=Stenotrophomonas sp. TaxID=69392 RepID=UPI0028AFDB02|nr:putative holin [Stenotrophomonas sp.]
MTEPTSTGGMLALATGVGLASLLPGIESDAFIGAFAGATLFVVSAKDLPIWKRLIYLAISVVAGYMGGTEVMRRFDVTSSGLAAFICAAVIVTLTLSLIERSRTEDPTKAKIRQGETDE